MKEQRIEVLRSARFYMLGAPHRGTTDVWIVCHGFAQLASRFLKRFDVAADSARLIVAPEALNRFYIDTSPRPHGPDALIGATWMTREDRDNEIRDYVRYLDAVHDEVMKLLDRASVRLLVLGFSQGAATVSRWVTMGAVKPDRVVLWSGSLPTDTEWAQGERWRGIPVSLVWGTKDAAWKQNVADSDCDRLAAAGAKCERIEFDGGHEIHSATLLRIADSK